MNSSKKNGQLNAVEEIAGFVAEKSLLSDRSNLERWRRILAQTSIEDIC